MTQVTVTHRVDSLPATLAGLIDDDRLRGKILKLITGWQILIRDVADSGFTVECYWLKYKGNNVEFRVEIVSGDWSDSKEITLTITNLDECPKNPQIVIDWIKAVVEFLNDIRRKKNLPTIEKINIEVITKEQL